ncbi:MAG: phosphatase PAP2 family protein [Acidobacteriota bacterium]
MKVAIKCILLFFSVTLCGFAIVPIAHAQQPVPPSTSKAAVGLQASPTPKPTPNLKPVERHFLQHILKDQELIWTSPFRLKENDLKWLVPLGVTATGLFFSDRETSSWVRRTGSLPLSSRAVSEAGKFYVTGGVAAGFYLIGKATKNRHAQETGVLAAEALIDTGIVTGVVKYAAERERPNADSGRGRFFTHGSSFPSGHASAAWSVATVIAYEYQDNPFIKYGAYAAAVAVSMSRYSGRNHFLSDILIGSAIGYGVGRFVYRRRGTQTDDVTVQTPPGTMSLIPRINPVYDRRTSTYGTRLLWTF